LCTSGAGKERRVAVDSGTNMAPMATPRRICGVSSWFQPLSRLQPCIPNRAAIITHMPKPRIGRGPMFQIRRPTKAITTAVAMLEGRIASPEFQAVQPSSDWV
jgi:hypothetical protein